MRIAIDLDGTILTFNWSDWMLSGMNYFGNPKRDAKKVIEMLYNDGHEIIIHTCRTNPVLIEGYSQKELKTRVAKTLADHGIKYHSIWDGQGKPIADIYIDDNGYKFENWIKVVDDLNLD